MRKIVIGDVQGCFDELMKLLDKLNFNSANDHLILLGDIVGRGPKSLEVIEYLYSIDHCVVLTLGNHDLHLLAMAIAGISNYENDESLNQIMNSRNKIQLIEWLRHQPIMYEEEDSSIMVHAGIHPSWNIDQTRKYAQEIEDLIRGRKAKKVLARMYTDDSWSLNSEGHSRINGIINCFTRIRFIDDNGVCNFKEKNSPTFVSRPLIPWFEYKDFKILDREIFFGHWSQLNYFRRENILCLDGGCLWGGELIGGLLEKPFRPIKVKALDRYWG